MRHLLLLPVVLLALAPAAKADDTQDFLNPANWDGRTDIWRMENGSIIGETKVDPGYNNFFCSKKKYTDFDLAFKVQLKNGVGNSGVQIRSTLTDPKKFIVHGPQVDVGKGYWGSLYGEGVGGMMKASDPAKIKSVVKESEFNDYHITVKGDHVTVKVNGTTMVDDDFPTLPGKTKKPFPADGIIAWQAHAVYKSMRVEFKDIRFVDLSKKK